MDTPLRGRPRSPEFTTTGDRLAGRSAEPEPAWGSDGAVAQVGIGRLPVDPTAPRNHPLAFHVDAGAAATRPLGATPVEPSRTTAAP